jgi:hypothetical protein
LIALKDFYATFRVFTLNFLPYKPTGPVSSNIYRPTIKEYTEDAIDNMILEFAGD